MEQGKDPPSPGRVPGGVSRCLASGEDEKRFRRLFDQSPLGAALLSPDFRFLEVNGKFSAITGYSPGELASRTFRDITHPDDLEEDLSLARKLLAGEIDHFEKEKRYIRKDGRTVWARVNVRGIRDEDGRLLYFMPLIEDITDRKGMEKALRESDAGFRASLEILPEGFVILKAVRDAGGRIVDFRYDYLNETACRMAGCRREDRVGRRVSEVYPAFPGSPLFRDYVQTVEDGTPLSRNGVDFLRAVAGEGPSDRCFNIRAARLGDGLVASWSDVTESRRMEETLRESEARFRTSLEILPECFAIFKAVRDDRGHTADLRCEYLNEAALRMTGLSREESLGRNLVELFPRLGKSALLRSLLLTLRGEETLVRNDVEFPGDSAIEGFSGRAFDIRAARLSDGLVVAWADVTERKESAEALRRKAEELETLLESVPVFVWIAHDPESRHVTGNRAADEFLRIPRKSEASLTASEGERPTHFRIVKDGRPLDGRELPVQRAARGELVTDFEYSVVFDDGTERDLSGNAAPLLDSEGRPRGSVSAIKDITERKRMEAALRASLSEKDDLLRELSHRTKNNMQVIAGLLMLQATRAKDERVTGALEEAQNRIRAMALVHEKLYKSGSATSLNMKVYVKDLLDSLLNAHQGAEGRIREVLDLEDVSLSLDAAVPLGLIINELVSNSLKHAFGKKELGTVFLSLRRDEGEVELRYGDDGPGLPGNLELLQVDSLGLKLVHSLAVRQLGGTMEVVPGPRGEFVFRFRDVGPGSRDRS